MTRDAKGAKCKKKKKNTKKEINYCLAVGRGAWRELQFFSLSTKPGLGWEFWLTRGLMSLFRSVYVINNKNNRASPLFVAISVWMINCFSIVTCWPKTIILYNINCYWNIRPKKRNTRKAGNGKRTQNVYCFRLFVYARSTSHMHCNVLNRIFKRYSFGLSQKYSIY